MIEPPVAAESESNHGRRSDDVFVMLVVNRCAWWRCGNVIVGDIVDDALSSENGDEILFRCAVRFNPRTSINDRLFGDEACVLFGGSR